MGSQNRMKYECAFVDRNWRVGDPLPVPPLWGPLGQREQAKIASGADRCITVPCHQGGVWQYYLCHEWASAEGDDYFRYARYSQREVPELLVRRFRPRMFVPSLLK